MNNNEKIDAQSSLLSELEKMKITELRKYVFDNQLTDDYSVNTLKRQQLIDFILVSYSLTQLHFFS